MKQTKFLLLAFLMLLFTACEAQLGGGDDPKEEVIPSTAAELEGYHYKIPVIFHVLYNNSSSTNVKVEQSRVSEIIKRVNIHYSGTLGGADMGIEFYLPTETSNKVPLEEAGINRVYVSGDYPLDYNEVMSGTDYKDILWNPNKYINVLLYSFTDSDLLGVSWMPYMPAESEGLMDGVNAVDYTSLTLNNLPYTYCVSINSTYINNQSYNGYYDPHDITVTLAHELGHYLGLHHVYAEAEDGSYADTCVDTDYCVDTKSYNRGVYEDYLEKLYSDNPKATFADLYDRLLLREDINGDKFTSDNYMDYDYSLFNTFTDDQRARTRAVLNYGLLMPGPKVVETRDVMKKVEDGVIDNIPSMLIK